MSTPAQSLPPPIVESAAEDGDGQQPRPRSSLSSFLFLSFLFFMITNNSGGDDSGVRRRYLDTLESLQWQYGNFTAWVNGTTTDNFTMPVNPPGEDKLVTQLRPPGETVDLEIHSYYSNVTGFIRGPSSVYNITTPSIRELNVPWAADAAAYMGDANMTGIIERLGSWNWTAVHRIAISALEKPQELDDEQKELFKDAEGILPVQGHIEVIDANTDEEMRLEFSGVHFVNNGSMYAFAEPMGSVIDIRELPSLVPPTALNITAHSLLPVLQERIKHLQALLSSSDMLTLDSSSPFPLDQPSSRCTFHVYAQLAPTNVSNTDMIELEEELMEPTGAHTVPRPPLLVDAILLSRDCGLLIQVEKAEGLRSRLFFRKVTTYAGFSAAVYLGLLILLSRQMAQSRSPAVLARISRWTFLSQIVADSIAFAGHITFAILADGRPSISLVAPAFLSCVLFAYEVQFAMLIHQVQAPEDAAPPRPRPSPPPLPTPQTASDAPGDSPSEPLLGATERQQQPTSSSPTSPPSPTPQRFAVIRQFWDILRNDHQARTWALISLLLFAVMRVILAPALAMVVFALLYVSIWAPQIYRAARRSRPCALSVEYMVGTTVGRLALGLYFMACPKNVLDITPRGWMYPLSFAMFIEVCFIMLQNTLGPAFFLPGSYAETSATHDYHPPLPPADSEAPSSLGDCAICMDAIERDDRQPDDREKPHTDVLSRFAGNSKGKRRSYSLAPCHHLFHTECLERWLAIKNICPQCRRPLPPL